MCTHNQTHTYTIYFEENMLWFQISELTKIHLLHHSTSGIEYLCVCLLVYGKPDTCFYSSWGESEVSFLGDVPLLSGVNIYIAYSVFSSIPRWVLNIHKVVWYPLKVLREPLSSSSDFTWDSFLAPHLLLIFAIWKKQVFLSATPLKISFAIS